MNVTSLMKPATQAIEDAIQNRETIHVKYRGGSRHVIPLVYGRLRNGREALLCYKILDHDAPAQSEIAFRLYHLSFLEPVKLPGEQVQNIPSIDYYLTKHFAAVYAKV